MTTTKIIKDTKLNINLAPSSAWTARIYKIKNKGKGLKLWK